MSDNNHAEGYQRTSGLIRHVGKGPIQNYMRSCSGDAILDLGCGTGELSAHLAELVGQQGKVVAVDPDIGRVHVAQETHKGVKNLTFHEGSAAYFPGMSSETYDIVFSNAVLHWVPDKREAFENMFRSLRPGGKIVLSYLDHLPPMHEHVYHELNPENLDRILNTYQLKTRSDIEKMCIAAGFDIVQSYDESLADRQYESGENLCSHFWATTHGIFDPKLVTEDRLVRFCARYSSADSPVKPFKVWAEEGDFYCITIATKPISM